MTIDDFKSLMDDFELASLLPELDAILGKLALLARIAVQLRSNASVGNDNAVCELALDFAARGVSVCGVQVHLTRTEYAILKLLMQNPNRVVSKSLILDRISDDTPDCTENSLKVHISNLHRKLRNAGGREYIESVWGIGFRLL